MASLPTHVLLCTGKPFDTLATKHGQSNSFGKTNSLAPVYWKFYNTVWDMLRIVKENWCMKWVEMALFWIYWLSLKHLLQTPYHFVTCTDIHVNYWNISMLLKKVISQNNGDQAKMMGSLYITWLHFVLCLTPCFLTKHFFSVSTLLIFL